MGLDLLIPTLLSALLTLRVAPSKYPAWAPVVDLKSGLKSVWGAGQSMGLKISLYLFINVGGCLCTPSLFLVDGMVSAGKFHTLAF